LANHGEYVGHHRLAALVDPMHVLHDVENRFGAGQIRRVDQGREPPPPGVRIDPGQRHRRIGDAQQVVENQEVVTIGVGKLGSKPRSRGRVVETAHPGRSAEQPRHGMERDLARVGFAICGKDSDTAAFGDLERLTDEPALPDPRRPDDTYHRPAAGYRALEKSSHGVQFQPASYKGRLRRPGPLTLGSHPKQAAGRHGRVGTLDRHHLRFAENGCTPDELRGRIAEHDPAWRRCGLHALRHPDLLADSGVTNCGGTEFTSYHLAGIQPYPQAEADTIPPIDVGGHILDFPLDLQGGRQARKA
jgi:hypothetical protein